MSRRTIHEWVETGQLDRDLSSGGARYSPRPAVPHKLAPYTGIIEARLEEFPGLSAQRLFDEVRAAGYPGGYSRVRDYVRAVRSARDVLPRSVQFSVAHKACRFSVAIDTTNGAWRARRRRNGMRLARASD